MVMGNGWLKTGFFGDLAPSNDPNNPNGVVTTWDPNTGKLSSSMMSQNLATPAAAAAAYAVAKGDARIIQNFGVDVPPGVTVLNNM
jgi:hypothetical protein